MSVLSLKSFHVPSHLLALSILLVCMGKLNVNLSMKSVIFKLFNFKWISSQSDELVFFKSCFHNAAVETLIRPVFHLYTLGFFFKKILHRENDSLVQRIAVGILLASFYFKYLQ